MGSEYRISDKDVGHICYLLNEPGLGGSAAISPKGSAIEHMQMDSDIGRTVRLSLKGWEPLYQNDFLKIADAALEVFHEAGYSGEFTVSRELEPGRKDENQINLWKKGTGYLAIMMSPDAVFINGAEGAHLLQDIWNKIQDEKDAGQG